MLLLMKSTQMAVGKLPERNNGRHVRDVPQPAVKCNDWAMTGDRWQLRGLKSFYFRKRPNDAIIGQLALNLICFVVGYSWYHVAGPTILREPILHVKRIILFNF
jgi:hypothetical protein